MTSDYNGDTTPATASNGGSSIPDKKDRANQNPMISAFFDAHPPLPGEVLTGFIASRIRSTVVMTTQRLWMYDKKRCEYVTLTLSEIAQMTVSRGWFTCAATVRFKDGTEQTYENLENAPSSASIARAIERCSISDGSKSSPNQAFSNSKIAVATEQKLQHGGAEASLVLGILGLTIIGLVGSISAIICGHYAKSKIKKNPDMFTGARMSLAGLILGYVQVGLMVVVIGFQNSEYMHRIVPLVDETTVGPSENWIQRNVPLVWDLGNLHIDTVEHCFNFAWKGINRGKAMLLGHSFDDEAWRDVEGFFRRNRWTKVTDEHGKPFWLETNARTGHGFDYSSDNFDHVGGSVSAEKIILDYITRFGLDTAEGRSQYSDMLGIVNNLERADSETMKEGLGDATTAVAVAVAVWCLLWFCRRCLGVGPR